MNSPKQVVLTMSDQYGPVFLGRTEFLPPLSHFYPVSSFVIGTLGCFLISSSSIKLALE